MAKKRRKRNHNRAGETDKFKLGNILGRLIDESKDDEVHNKELREIKRRWERRK